MSDEIGREDTVLGTALARAIDSQPVRATPFAGSRLAARMAGGGRSPLMPVLAAAAAIVLGLALGAALLGQRGGDREPAATEPTASPAGSPTASPQQGSPTVVPPVPVRVYFARDQLPPVGAIVMGSSGPDDRPETRISGRISALWGALPHEVPAGAANTFAQSGRSGSEGTLGLSVQISGDLATVTFDLGTAGWRVSGSAASQALLQQLVYTITEEPGIWRALIKEKGKSEATIDQLVLDKPLSREDVLPYEGVKTEERVALEDDPRPSTATTRIEDLVGGIRFIIELKADQTPAEGFWSPRMEAALRPNDRTSWNEGTFNSSGQGLDRAKSVLQVRVGAARPALDGYRVVAVGQQGAEVLSVGLLDVDRTPLRFVLVTQPGRPEIPTTIELGLDDARPWRISLEPGAARGTMRLIVDIGGHPQAISDSVAVNGPKPGDSVVRTFTLTGAARAFEAHVAWRLKDSRDREVATGFVTASLGTSPVWGTFSSDVKVPDSVSGVVTLEVFWPSPRDGSPVGLVAIPLRVR